MIFVRYFTIRFFIIFIIADVIILLHYATILDIIIKYILHKYYSTVYPEQPLPQKQKSFKTLKELNRVKPPFFPQFQLDSQLDPKKLNCLLLLRHESRYSKQTSFPRSTSSISISSSPQEQTRDTTTFVARSTKLSRFLAATRDLLRNCALAWSRPGTIRVKRHRQATSVLRRRLTDERVRRLSSTRSTGHVPRNERKLRRKRDWEQQPRIGRAIPLGEANPVIGRSCNPLPLERENFPLRTILSFSFPRSSGFGSSRLKKGFFVFPPRETS